MMEKRLHAQLKAAPPPSFTPVRGGVLQRKCACGGSAGIAGECDECSKQNLSLQRSTRNSELETRNSAGAPPIVHEVLRSPGQPLDQETRAFFEPRFGHDFSRVRVHTDARAAESASAVNASAYTVGRQVVFGPGRYAPDRISGKMLLAHELTHVMQQESSQGGVPLRMNPSTVSAETEAAQAARTAVAGKPAQPVTSLASSAFQLSPLSDEVAGAWTIGTDEVFEVLREHCPLKKPDPDLEVWLMTNLSGNDLWLAQKIVQKGAEPLWDGADITELSDRTNDPNSSWSPAASKVGATLGTSSGLLKDIPPTPVQAYFFQGQTDERAMVIGGVHGSELSGVEVVKLLLDDLQNGRGLGKQKPYYSVIIVPQLFPDSVAYARAHRRDKDAGKTDPGREIVLPGRTIYPARNYPPAGKSLGTARREGLRDEDDKPLKHDGHPVDLLPETEMLLELIERFKPTRIASVHAHSFDEEAFKKKDRTTDFPGVFVDPREGANKEDDALALAMAKAVQANAPKDAGNVVPGNWLGTDKPQPHYTTPKKSPPPGFSLGAWGPYEVREGGPADRPAMTIITVEVQRKNPSDGNLTRLGELKAHMTALEEIFLGKP